MLEGRVPVVVPDETANDDLVALAGWAAARSPLAVVSSVADDALVVDLDGIDEASDPDRLRAFLRTVDPAAAVRGSVLASESAVAACVAAGIRLLVATPRLPVLLAAAPVCPGRRTASRRGTQALNSISQQDLESLLELFDRSNWRELRVQGPGIELFASKDPNARMGDPAPAIPRDAAQSRAAVAPAVVPAAR